MSRFTIRAIEQMLATLGSSIAVALENARLYQKVNENERRLADDLRTAREIQGCLLPDGPPDVAGLDVGFVYRPARELGGDLVDFLSYDDDRIAVVVGDAAGKGAAAALHAATTIGVLRGLVMQSPGEPAAMLTTLDRQVRRSTLDNRFVSMAFALYERQAGTLTVASAGFPRPLLLRSGKVEEIDVTGVPLGLLSGSHYRQEQVQVEPGDLLVLCSDGVNEASNGLCEDFGLSRVEALLAAHAGWPAQEIADLLVAETERFSSTDCREPDDRTVVVLKVS